MSGSCGWRAAAAAEISLDRDCPPPHGSLELEEPHVPGKSFARRLSQGLNVFWHLCLSRSSPLRLSLGRGTSTPSNCQTNLCLPRTTRCLPRPVTGPASVSAQIFNDISLGCVQSPHLSCSKQSREAFGEGSRGETLQSHTPGPSGALLLLPASRATDDQAFACTA